MFVQGFERLLDCLVVAVKYRVVGLTAKDVSGNQRFEIGHNHISGNVNIVPSRGDSVIGGIVNKHVDQFLIAGRHAQELLIVAHFVK